jgi:hypothetical protein
LTADIVALARHDGRHGYRLWTPEVFVLGLAAWSPALVGAAPTATLPAALRHAMN